MTPKAKGLVAVIRNLRPCFHQLKALADRLHKDLGITASMRAVLESLAEGGEQTVPQIARTKGVSRQHIQVNVDALLDGRFVVMRDNPAHKRSPMVTLTKQGRLAFKEMQRREQVVLEELAAELPLDALVQTGETLAVLKKILFQTTKEGLKND